MSCTIGSGPCEVRKGERRRDEVRKGERRRDEVRKGERRRDEVRKGEREWTRSVRVKERAGSVRGRGTGQGL